MTDEMTIGQRVAFYRRRRGLSQEVLAGLVGKTTEWLRKIETSRAELDRLSVIRTLASALDVSLGDVVGEPSLFDWSEETGRQTIPALRAALRDYRHLSPVLGRQREGDLLSLTVLERDVAEVWDSYQRSRYGELARRLPDLINECLTAERALGGDERLRAHALTAYAHQVAALFLTKLGETDLAWTAASRGLIAANASEDNVAIGSLSRAVAHALTSNGEYREACAVGAAAAEFLQPLMSAPTPHLLSVYGSLHLMCALSAARDDDRQLAGTHLAEAAESARQLGGDANHVWTAFGPTNVTIHQVCVALELGDIQRAMVIGPDLDTSALPVERRVRHSIEVARVFVRHNKAEEALTQLLDAERVAPDQVRYHQLSRMIVREILARPRPPRLAGDLAHRMGVRPSMPW